MNTLIIDTHSEKLFFAIVSNDTIIKKEKTSKQSHSEIAIPTLVDLLKEASLQLRDIDEIIVINGPGSFTGVRIGVTIAKTIAYSLNIKIKTVTSLEAYGISIDKPKDLIVIKDTKGFYSAKINNQKFEELSYRKKQDFEEYISSNNFSYIENNEIDIPKLLKYLLNKDYVNAHEVNPIYIKEIDVEK